jgi:MoxR-like ATPase
VAVLDSQQYIHPIEELQQVVEVPDLTQAQERVKEIYVDPLIKKYIVDLVNQTRKHGEVYLGASPRGSLALYRTSQVRAAILGRDYVIPDDIKALAVPTLAHRIIIGPAARIKDVDTRQIVQEILTSLPVPGAAVGVRA